MLESSHIFDVLSLCSWFFCIWYLCLFNLIVCIQRKSLLVISWKLGSCHIFFHSLCYQQIKLPVETLPSVYSYIQLGCIYVCICIDIDLCKYVFMCLGFYSIGEHFFSKHLLSLICFSQRFGALSQTIFRHTKLLFLSIIK